MVTDRAYVDSNVFFYAKILDRKYGKSCVQILEDIHSKRLEGMISVLVCLEVGNALHKYNLPEEVEYEVSAITSLPLLIQQVDATILRDAVRIHDQKKVGIYDCVHAATMKQAKLTKIITADQDFKRIPWITPIDPLEYNVE